MSKYQIRDTAGAVLAERSRKDDAIKAAGTMPTAANIFSPSGQTVWNRALHTGVLADPPAGTIPDITPDPIDQLRADRHDLADVTELDLYAQAKADHAALKAWKKSGQVGDTPATPALDELRARKAAGRKVSAKPKRETRVRTGSVDGDVETITCRGACAETKSARHFPTVGAGKRGTECRSCRDARLAAKKAGTPVAEAK